MTIKRWVLAMFPSDETPHGFMRYDTGSFDEALRRVRDDAGNWKAGASIEVTYEGVKEDEGFRQSEFLTEDGWLQGQGKEALTKRQRFEEAARERRLPRRIQRVRKKP